MSKVKNMVNQSSYLVLDTVSSKFLNTLGFIILTHILSSGDIGILGISLGYIAIVNLFSILPESILLKEKIKNNKQITSFITFWFIKSIALMLMTLGISYFLYVLKGDLLLSMFFILYGIHNIFVIFTEMWDFLFFMQNRQKFNFYINLLFSIIKLVGILFITTKSDVMCYGYLLIGLFAAKGLFQFFKFRKDYSFKFDFKGNYKLIMSNLKEFTLVKHFNGITLMWIFYIDTIILPFFVSTDIIGDYTVAVKIAFLAFHIPLLFEKIMSQAFKNVNLEECEKYLGVFVKFLVLKGILVLTGFIIFGRLILTYIFKVQNIDFVYNITTIILFSIILLNSAWPIISLIITKFDVKESLYRIILPTFVSSAIIFYAMTMSYGVYGTAISNIISYGLFMILAYYYTKGRFRIRTSRKLEREIFSEIKLKILRK